MIDVKECGSHLAASEALSQAQAIGLRELGKIMDDEQDER